MAGRRVQSWPFAAKSLSATSMLAWSALALVTAATVFKLLPDLDIAVASRFYISQRRFAGNVQWVAILRYALQALYAGSLAFALFAAVWSLYKGASTWGIGSAHWIFVSLALIVGPGLVANVLLKDQVGRPRPNQIEVFGGKKQFAPALAPSAECQRNCSFVSGEASSMFALCFGLAFVSATRARPLVAAGLALGSIAGLIRMSEGGHFLSDIVFAGIFMAATVAVLKLACLEAWPALRRQVLPNQLPVRAS